MRMAKKKQEHPDFFGEQFNLPGTEEKVLEFWEKEKVFEGIIRRAQKEPKAKKFVFFEGPPTANGHPGIHHVLARSFKDIICRYKTMRGYRVLPRIAGWDTHGLPVELQVEKALGLKSKKDIEAYGVGEFNQKCRDSVWEFKDEWERLTRRMGFWIDTDNAYITYRTPYIETLWWIIDRLYQKGLLYQGHKVVPWCSRCGTSLSSHELGQPGAYQEVTEPSVYMKLRLTPGQKIGRHVTTDNATFALSWTTTPWTLPGNVALAVGADINYALVKYRRTGERFIVARDLAEKVLGDQYDIQALALGLDLVGLTYEPLFEVKPLRTQTSHKIYAAPFVTTTDGTGIVHTAVMYGEDDYKLGLEQNLPQIHTVDEAGKFTADVPELSGVYVKSKEATEKIIKYMTATGTLLKTELYSHEYPHCWRCNTALLYYARVSWFVAVNKVRKHLISANQSINWVPDHVKTGRFGQWLTEEKDWNFSRQRYWGTPLPIWQCEHCRYQETVGSLAGLSRRASSGNQIFFLRHTESVCNVKDITAGNGPDDDSHPTPLTSAGEKQLAALVGKIKKEKFDAIYTSPFSRTRILAQAIATATGATLVCDPRLAELNHGVLSGAKRATYQAFFKNFQERFVKAPEKGETITQARARMVAAVRDIDSQHKNKKILFVSHGDPLWLAYAALTNMPEADIQSSWYPTLGELKKVDMIHASYNTDGLIDLHRPFIDSIALPCLKCAKGVMKRIPDLADVWFDSGAMPYAQAHFPFEKGQSYKDGKASGIDFPADYITEAVDQTRGWFYTLLAVAGTLGLPAPYKNVVCLGLINDKQGKKMSKSKGNIVDPWDMANRFGMDATRWYFYTVNPPGEPKNFDEAEVSATARRVHSIVYNCFLFYKTYANTATAPSRSRASKNILDIWIMNRLRQTTSIATSSLDAYDIREAALAIEKLIDDLSRWYIRRSRRRLQKPESSSDYAAASATLAYVLSAIAGLMAPFSPFFAEALAAELARVQKKSITSIHTSSYPVPTGKADIKLLAAMQSLRDTASAALAVRATHKIKVRQPLATLTIKSAVPALAKSKGLLEILADEVNVKKVVFDKKISAELELDTVITTPLRREGIARELARATQELRQKAGVRPGDRITLHIDVTDPEIRAAVEAHQKSILSQVSAVKILWQKASGLPHSSILDIDGTPVAIAIEK